MKFTYPGQRPCSPSLSLIFSWPQRKVEISDDDGFSGIFQSMANAAKVCQIPNASTIKYALDRNKDIFRRRSDNKKFYIREILDYDEESGADETKSETEESATDEKSETDESETDVSDVDEDKISNFDFESGSEPEAKIVFESDSEPESEPDDSDSGGNHSGSSSESESESN